MYDTYFLIIYNESFSIHNIFRLSTAQILVVQGKNKIYAPSKDAENAQWDRKSMSSSQKAYNFSAVFMAEHLVRTLAWAVA